MVMSHQATFRVGLGLLVLIGLTLGCSGTGGQSSDDLGPEGLQVQKIGQLCLEYRKTHKNPPTIEDLKGWAVKEGKATPEEFMSTRDNQPYALAQAMQGMVVHEQTGADGKVYVFTPNGRVVEMEEADLQNMLGSMPKNMTRGRGGKK